MPRNRTPSHRSARPSGPAGPPDARSRALQALTQAVRTFPEALPEGIDESGLEHRDAALAHTIVESTVRYWRALAYLLGGFLRQPFASLDPGVGAALLGGAAQLVVLDRIPAHAAIDTTVEWVKHAVRPGAAGLVNAVLRRVHELVVPIDGPRPPWQHGRQELPAPDGGAILLARAVLPESPAARLAIATGHTEWLIDRWISRLGLDAARGLAHHSLVRAPTVLNTDHLQGGAVTGLSAHDDPGSSVSGLGRSELRELLEKRHDLWVQDAGAARAVRSVAGMGPRLVVDLCAGRGTKTRQLALTFPDAEVLACDPDAQRSRSLGALPARYANVRVLSTEEVLRSAAGRADLVLLDVPCSNTGVLARRLGAKHRAGAEQLVRLTAIQASILDAARPLLAPEGVVLYSTCSLDDEENGRIARESATRLGLAVESERASLPSGLPGQSPAGYRDGSYSAVLRG